MAGGDFCLCWGGFAGAVAGVAVGEAGPRSGMTSKKNYIRSGRAAEPAHEAGGWEFCGEEAVGGVENGAGGEAAGADGGLHGGGPLGAGPVAGEEEARPGGLLRGAVAVKAGGDGEGGASFFEDGGLEELGGAGFGEEEREFAEGFGEDLFAGEVELGEGAADNELEVGAAIGGPAADAGFMKEPLDAGVEQGGVVDGGDFAVVPEVDGGDGGGVKVVGYGFGVDAGLRGSFAAKWTEELLGLAKIGGEDDGGGFEGLSVA